MTDDLLMRTAQLTPEYRPLVDFHNEYSPTQARQPKTLKLNPNHPYICPSTGSSQLFGSLVSSAYAHAAKAPLHLGARSGTAVRRATAAGATGTWMHPRAWTTPACSTSLCGTRHPTTTSWPTASGPPAWCAPPPHALPLTAYALSSKEFCLILTCSNASF